jgi:hypothetical protein
VGRAELNGVWMIRQVAAFMLQDQGKSRNVSAVRDSHGVHCWTASVYHAHVALFNRAGAIWITLYFFVLELMVHLLLWPFSFVTYE